MVNNLIDLIGIKTRFIGGFIKRVEIIDSNKKIEYIIGIEE
jgi:hypothetical protein